ncbi:hypothetical protein [Polyangium spumosum]|uniref:Lipocalin-like domain-containing protein n=1 Tax=Polyangium spumosum TaxID=889282 RepID=A0A6N7PSH3_9BACT|nr:hypothetical protein [Polyangium spumosum]MRG94943.1 hypothetical protein [Polyangium spumosum]
MNRFVIPMLALSLVACAPDWDGTYAGEIKQSGFCNDGSSVPETEADVEFTVLHETETDTLSWDAACGATVLADLEGDVAKVRQASCPAETSNGTTRSSTIEGGTLTFSDTTMRMELDISVTLSGAITGTCNVTAEGLLVRIGD